MILRYDQGMTDAKHTERSALDALHRRYCVPGGYGRPQRHVIAEHVPDHPWRPRRTIDAIVVDTWPGTYVNAEAAGYGLHGIEVKVTRSDLRRELADLTKSGEFIDDTGRGGEERGILSHYSILAPTDVLKGWRDMGIPDTWGILALKDDGTIRAARKPTRLRDEVRLTIGAAATLARAVHKTTAQHCTRHGGTIDPTARLEHRNWGHDAEPVIAEAEGDTLFPIDGAAS